MYTKSGIYVKYMRCYFIHIENHFCNANRTRCDRQGAQKRENMEIQMKRCICVCVCMRIYPFVLIFFSIVFVPKFGNVVVAG